MPSNGLIRLLLAIGIGLGIYKGVEEMLKKKIFISFAMEDKTLRDFLVGQSKHEDTPFDFADYSVKEPWDSAWKTNCKSRIKGCDGVIAIVTPNTGKASGQLWEIKCAKDEGVPFLAIYGNDNRSYSLPTELSGSRVNVWTWDNIKNFVRSL
jgi:hypothetical protein